MTNDLVIRHKLIDDLQKKVKKDSKVRLLSEVEICMGFARVDVMLVNGVLHGFEIKSDKDTLERLVHQSLLYDQVFEKMTLVCGLKHFEDAKKIIPPWWGIKLAYFDKNGTLRLKQDRLEHMNPHIDPYSLVQLLWKDEVLMELEKLDLAKGYRSKPRNILWDRLVNSVNIYELRRIVKERIKSRRDWRTVELQA